MRKISYEGTAPDQLGLAPALDAGDGCNVRLLRLQARAAAAGLRLVMWAKFCYPAFGMPSAAARPVSNLRCDSYRKALERKRAEVRAGLSPPVAIQVQNGPADDAELAVRKHDEWLFLNRNRIEVELLRQINDALQRIQDGVYGICESCEDGILENRLKALPWARYCIDCQEARSV